MDITEDDYKRERHIFVFCRWINQKLYDLEKEPDFYKRFFERTRKGTDWKKFLEEAIPVSYLGLYLYRAWREVFVQCFTDNPQYDAKIIVRSPDHIQTIKVEVTTTEDTESAWRREALSGNGFAYLTGPVEKDKKTGAIIFKPKMVDDEEEGSKIVESALERLDRKLQNQYDDETAILIYVAAQQKLYPHHRCDLMKKVRLRLRERRPALYGVFVCYSWNLGVDEIINIDK